MRNAEGPTVYINIGIFVQYVVKGKCEMKNYCKKSHQIVLVLKGHCLEIVKLWFTEVTTHVKHFLSYCFKVCENL
jgi:hypothetical protein